jgi:Phosphotransferase enzyme family
VERRLDGGNAGGAVLVDGTVRRPTGPWTPAVHAVLRHLEQRGFPGAPRVLGVDEQGREILTYLAGATVGNTRPWPRWVHSDSALQQVGRWLRSYHDAVRDFVPPRTAMWRTAMRPWRPGDIIGHNDAAPYNAVWQPGRDGTGRLVGFIDWDFAAPCSPSWDLAFTVFSWVPLHAREVVAAEGFTDFSARPRRLRLFLDAYGWTGRTPELLDVVTAWIESHIGGLQALAVRDPVFARLLDAGVADTLHRALVEIAADRTALASGG